MRVTADFSAFRPAVEQVSAARHVALRADFQQIIRAELTAMPGGPPSETPDEARLQHLYELRARYLDWELGTGYLGMFAQCPGTRYTFTRRLEEFFRLLPDLRPEFRVLEIGCGAGLICLKLAPFASLVVGIDVSPSALNFANHLKRRCGCANVVFQHASATHLAFQDQVFDLVLCSEVLEHLTTPERALREMRRVTKNSGEVIVSVPAAFSLSDGCMALLRRCTSRFEIEKSVQFDKRTYLAVTRADHNQSRAVPPERLDVRAFIRIHLRFRYQVLADLFCQAGFRIERAAGAVLAFPPHYQLVYRLCPRWLLALVRYLEQGANRVHVFQRVGAVTTCFHLKPL